MLKNHLLMQASHAFAAAAALLLGCGSSQSDDGKVQQPDASTTSQPDTSGGQSDTGSGQSDPDSFGKKFKVADNEIAGWTLQTVDPSQPSVPTFKVYTAATLKDRIDGGDEIYLQKGMRLAMFQEMVGANDTTCQIVAMDFGTSDQANAEYNVQLSTTEADVAIPGYDASTAMGYSTLTGVTLVGHVKAFYFEVEIDGISDQTAAAQAAASFFKALATKSQ